VDIGLYTLKYPFRRLITFLLPFFKNTNPNNISWFLLVIGFLTAFTYWVGISSHSGFALLLTVLLGFVRMIFATLDGLVALEFNKSTVLGDVVNRMTPEICDLILYPVLVIATGHLDILGISVVAMSWAISYFGLLGTASSCPVQSVGPTGQTDRFAGVMLFSFLQSLGIFFLWEVNFLNYFFYWVLVGGVLTLALRISRTFKAAIQKDLSVGKENK
jgi:CDP-diacylglycerol--glycerol-3-phosphate 3-phosphatidyltransferase